MGNLKERTERARNDEGAPVRECSGKILRKQRRIFILARGVLLAALVSITDFLFLSSLVQAAEVTLPKGPKYAIDETRWVTLGMGFRGTGLWVENPATGNLRSGDFSIDNARFYLNGQIHQYLKFEVNTECFFCNNTHSSDNPKMSYNILDAVGTLAGASTGQGTSSDRAGASGT